MFCSQMRGAKELLSFNCLDICISRYVDNVTDLGSKMPFEAMPPFDGILKVRCLLFAALTSYVIRGQPTLSIVVSNPNKLC